MASLRHRGPPLSSTSVVSSSPSVTFFLAIVIILSLLLTHSSALLHHRHHGKIIKNRQRPVPSLHVIQTRHRRLEDSHLDLYLAPKKPLVRSEKAINPGENTVAAAPLRGGFKEMLPKASGGGGIMDIPTSGSSLCHNSVLESVEGGGYYGNKYYYYCGRKTHNGEDVGPASTFSDP